MSEESEKKVRCGMGLTGAMIATARLPFTVRSLMIVTMSISRRTRRLAAEGPSTPCKRPLLGFQGVLVCHTAVDDPIGIELLDTYLASYGIVDSMKTRVFQPSFQWYIIYRGETRG